MPPDPASQLDQLALEALRKGDAALAARIARVAEELRAHMDSLSRDRLTDANKARKLGTMSEAAIEPPAKRPGRPTETKHPFAVALAERGSSVAEWARAHKLSRETVQFWVAAKGRKIPRAYAEAIEKELGVPATAAVWKNGIR